MSLGNCKWKQWDTTTHLLEWPKPRTLTTLNTGEYAEQRELSLTAGGNAEWHSHCGRQHAGFLQKSTYSDHMIPRLCLLVFSQRRWTLKFTEKPEMIIYSSFIHNYKNLKQLRCPSVGEWINRLIHSDNGLLFSTKKKWKDMVET